MPVEVLNGANPAETPIQFQETAILMVNKSAAQRMGITIPQDLLEEAEVVE